MRDQTHNEFVERWALYVKSNPDKWQKIHTRFINSLISHNIQFIKKLSKQAGGREKIIELYDIKNVNGYKKILG